MRQILSLTLFSCPKGSAKVDLKQLHARIAWAINEVETALCSPTSEPGRVLDQMGFGTLVLMDSKIYAVIPFDLGHKVRISDDGRGLVREGARGEDNLHDMLVCLRTAYDYLTWVILTEEASAASTRPPVFDTEKFGGVDERIRGWIGVQAEAYLEYWKREHRAQQAARAAAAVEHSDHPRPVYTGAVALGRR